MRDFHLRFFIERRWPDGMVESLLDESNSNYSSIPEKAASYVLGTSDGTKFTYPWGESPVFYIGQASNLRTRLIQHGKLTLNALENHNEYWWPRYQYAAAFGCDVAWYTTRGLQNPNRLEADLINAFYESYGSIPVANGTWPSGLRPKSGTRDD